MNPPPRRLQDLLAEARTHLQHQAPDTAQDAAVRTRLQALLPPERSALNGGSRLALRWAGWSGAGLGALALLLALGLLLVEPPLPPRTPAHDSGFLPVVSAAEWQQALADYGHDGAAAVLLLPAEMPRERLALLGLPYDTGRAAEPLRAELMLNPQGRLLAVRFLE